MTVRELIAQLQTMPQDLQVWSIYDCYYGIRLDKVQLVPKEQTTRAPVNPDVPADLVLISSEEDTLIEDGDKLVL